MRLFILLTFLLTTGCGTLGGLFDAPRKDVTDGIKEGVIYKRDMNICIDGRCAQGVLVVPKKKEYQFKVEAHGTLDLFTFSTCHREDTSEAHAKRRWFGKSNKKVEGYFSPSPGLESEYCPGYIGGYDKKGLHSWGFVDFESDAATIPAEVYCNGETIKANGVSVCQSKKGLIQAVKFDRPVVLAINEGQCEIEESEDGGLNWRFKMPRGECVKVFFDKDDNMHRMTLLGYDKIIIRGGK